MSTYREYYVFVHHSEHLLLSLFFTRCSKFDLDIQIVIMTHTDSLRLIRVIVFPF